MFLVDTAATFGIDFGTGATVGTVTVDITRADGTLLVDDGATTDNGDGTYSFELSSSLNDQLDLLRLEWTVVSTSEVVPTHEEIVGSLLFTIAEARGARFTGQQAPLSDDTVFPDSEIARMREQITRRFEQETGKSWVRRYARVEVPGTGTFSLPLWRGVARAADGNSVGGPGRARGVSQILSATANGTTVDPAIIVPKGNRLLRTSGFWPASTQSDPLNVVVEFGYGDDPVDLEARENGLRTVVANLIPSDLPDYAQTISQSDQSLSLQQNQGLRTVPVKTREWLNRHKSMVVA